MKDANQDSKLTDEERSWLARVSSIESDAPYQRQWPLWLNLVLLLALILFTYLIFSAQPAGIRWQTQVLSEQRLLHWPMTQQPGTEAVRDNFAACRDQVIAMSPGVELASEYWLSVGERNMSLAWYAQDGQPHTLIINHAGWQRLCQG